MAHTPEDLPEAPIGSYAMLGDCGSAALVGLDGSIDWLCWPRFDSDAIFAALLDTQRGGRFRIAPVGHATSHRRYPGGVPMCETTFVTDTGELRLRDVMLLSSDASWQQSIRSMHCLCRVMECTRGEVTVELVYEPKPRFARCRPRLEQHGLLGWFVSVGPGVVVLRSEVPLQQHSARPVLEGRCTLVAGEKRRLVLSFDFETAAALPLLGEHLDEQIEATRRWWTSWVQRCDYSGPYRDVVINSAVALKLMTYSPTGAIIAAPTTSLPEEPGGSRNWDYRYCWLRDAALTMRALLELGYVDEGEAFLYWMLHNSLLRKGAVRVLYDVHGGIDLREKHIETLTGYRGATPVRVGNGAKDQLQLGVHGSVIGAAFELMRRQGKADPSETKLLEGLGRSICECWRARDHGIWEVRGEPRHFTHSKVMCWSGLRQLVELHDEELLCLKDPERLRRTAEQIRRDVLDNAYDRDHGTFVSWYGADGVVDASLLQLAFTNFCEPTDPRMLRTFERIESKLARGPLLMRYGPEFQDGLAGQEVAFGICSFWAVEYLAGIGELDAARRRFEALLEYANDLGLLAEEVDPETGEQWGNFPQAFSQIGLINAAISLEQAAGRHEPDVRSGAGVIA